ncbi:MAG: hypothetical protein JKY10_11800 [Cohaesibacteraceae bacterium]|nr:hypothetical protein [Cohaesibacteraceae bacterium]
MQEQRFLHVMASTGQWLRRQSPATMSYSTKDHNCLLVNSRFMAIPQRLNFILIKFLAVNMNLRF